MHKKALDIVAMIAHIDDNYYPAILRKFYLLNAPYVFTVFWNIIKKFLNERTASKFEVLGCMYQCLVKTHPPSKPRRKRSYAQRNNPREVHPQIFRVYPSPLAIILTLPVDPVNFRCLSGDRART